MSRSIHTTYKNLKDTTKTEIDQMFEEPNSILHKLAEKKAIKTLMSLKLYWRN